VVSSEDFKGTLVFLVVPYKLVLSDPYMSLVVSLVGEFGPPEETGKLLC
jgi:hypothetical protein